MASPRRSERPDRANQASAASATARRAQTRALPSWPCVHATSAAASSRSIIVASDIYRHATWPPPELSMRAPSTSTQLDTGDAWHEYAEQRTRSNPLLTVVIPQSFRESPIPAYTPVRHSTAGHFIDVRDVRYGCMATHSLRKSNRYRFHDSARKDRKFLILALASALLLAALLSGLVIDFPLAFLK